MTYNQILAKTSSEFYQKGKKDEESVMQSLLKNAIPSFFSTKQQDINEGYDIVSKIKMDVKGLRKRNRKDGYDENIHFVELKNVKGELGWLYGGSHFFVFATEDYWIFVNKKELQNFIHEKCKNKEYGADSNNKELYKLYTRSDRKDVITMVKTLDLCRLSFLILDKEKENVNTKENEEL